jgi:hypothetical protein
VLLSKKGGLGDGVCESENGGQHKLAGNAATDFWSLDQMETISIWPRNMVLK